jgi:hypothetical protein
MANDGAESDTNGIKKIDQGDLDSGAHWLGHVSREEFWHQIASP